MPLTFGAHQAPVLPLKMAAPHWFDGTGLVVGSVAPDLFFVVRGTSWELDGHGFWEQFWLCLPVAVVLTVLTKRVMVAPVARCLPDGGPFQLRDYGLLAEWQIPKSVLRVVRLIVSVLVGTLSHVAIDGFTHGFGWVVQRSDFLRSVVIESPPGGFSEEPVYLYDVLQVVGTLFGVVVFVWCCWSIGTRRLVREWYPGFSEPADATPEMKRALGLGAVLGTLLGLMIAGSAGSDGGAQAVLMRVLVGVFLGLLAGSIVSQRELEKPS